MKWSIPAGIAAAIAGSEYQRRNIRSVKCIKLHDAVEMIKGSASTSTSRNPQGRVHHVWRAGRLGEITVVMRAVERAEETNPSNYHNEPTSATAVFGCLLIVAWQMISSRPPGGWKAGLPMVALGSLAAQSRKGSDTLLAAVRSGRQSLALYWADMNEREHDADALVDTLRLALVPGVGPRIRQTLLERFGSARAVLTAAPSELRSVPRVGPKLTGQILAASREIDAEAEIAICRQEGVTILTDTSDGYPRVLNQIHDPPAVLFLRGQYLPQDELSIAIVGTRHPTQYGLRQAERLAGSLARAGLTIVSGLARGIDAAAHRGAIAAGGRTLAILGSGVLCIYPPEHVKLAEEVVAHGGLMSESPPRAAPMAGVFPQRNRIISGLTLGTIVVEAGDRSGALITARLAMEQGREVFAVPGRVDDRTSRGCHRLIRDGVKLVETADDVLEELGPLFTPTKRDDGQPIHHPAELLLNELEQQILSAIGSDATSMDEIMAKTGLPIQNILSTVSVLEMRHLVRRLSGTTLVRL
jgi:DNA processing protein